MYGAMHVEICACLRLLARLNYIMGDYSEVSRSSGGVSSVLSFLPHACSSSQRGVTHSGFCSVQALSNQQKAVLMSERVLGIEHPNTIQEYVSMGSSSTSGVWLQSVSLSLCLQLENGCIFLSSAAFFPKSSTSSSLMILQSEKLSVSCMLTTCLA